MAANSFTKKYSANKKQSREIRKALNQKAGTVKVKPGNFTSLKELNHLISK